MKGDEFKIVLEDINEKFGTIIEGQKLLNGRALKVASSDVR